MAGRQRRRAAGAERAARSRHCSGREGVEARHGKVRRAPRPLRRTSATRASPVRGGIVAEGVVSGGRRDSESSSSSSRPTSMCTNRSSACGRPEEGSSSLICSASCWQLWVCWMANTITSVMAVATEVKMYSSSDWRPHDGDGGERRDHPDEHQGGGGGARRRRVDNVEDPTDAVDVGARALGRAAGYREHVPADAAAGVGPAWVRSRP